MDVWISRRQCALLIADVETFGIGVTVHHALGHPNGISIAADANPATDYLPTLSNVRLGCRLLFAKVEVDKSKV
jgi:hypothetical protein